MKYFFILGRNPELSLAEIMSYLERENINLLKYSINENGLLIEITEKLDIKKLIDQLGGTIAIGEVTSFGKKDDILKYLESKEIYFGESLKFEYSMINFADEESYDEVLQKVKDKFKKEKLRAFYRSSTGTVDLQETGFTSGSPNKIKSRDVVYFLFKGTDYSFGELNAVYNSNESEKRDINKPIRREELAISPRLAKILINLSQVKKNQTLLDPFCGIGAVLMEALLQDINVIGIDIDTSAINGAKRNLLWLKLKYKITTSSQVINEDSREMEIPTVDGIATEPSLGELLKITPTEEKAERMIEDFENLMIDVLNNTKQALKPGQKIAFTSPLIRTHHARKGCDITRIQNNTKLKMHKVKYLKNLNFPIVELRKDSIVGREFYVLEK